MLRYVVLASAFLVACGSPTAGFFHENTQTSGPRVSLSSTRDMRATRLSRDGRVTVAIVVHNEKLQPVASVPVTFEIAQKDSESVELLNAAAVSNESGVATTVVTTPERAATVIVHAEIEGQDAIDIEVVAERDPTPIDGEYPFTMQLEPLKLLEKPTAIILDDVSRALIDPIAFVLDGILVVDDHGNVSRNGLCELITSGPGDIEHCVRDVGALFNALLDMAIAQVTDPAVVRQAMADAGRALKEMHLGGTLTLRTEEMKAGPLEAQLSWDRLLLASGKTLDLRGAELAPFSAVMAGNAVERADGSGVDITLDEARVQFAYATLALAMVERIVLPKLLPSFDTNQDQMVTLSELFSKLTRCETLSTERRAACEATAPALAALIESGILPRLTAEMPKGFDVTMRASLTVVSKDAPPALDAVLVFAGINGRSQTVHLH